MGRVARVYMIYDIMSRAIARCGTKGAATINSVGVGGELRAKSVECLLAD